jgi:hypothetical protein
MSKTERKRTERIRIYYPKSAAGKKQWNKRFSLNAYWSGKHHAERAEDAKFWHAIVWAAMAQAKIPKKVFERPAVITFLWNDGLDIDNHAAMGKSITDALKNWVIQNDSRRYLAGVEHYFHDEDYIEVIIREI